MKFRIAHTPDPDDSFMFYGMFEKKIPCAFEYQQTVKDIETLNAEAPRELYDVTAISAGGYAYFHDRYRLTSSGASFGLSYGPKVIARKDVDLSKSVVAVPGEYTSSFLLYRMFAPEPREFRQMRFDLIPEAVLSGQADAGVLIHDEQLTFREKGLIEVMDLYEQWKKYAGSLPVPLGFNAIRKAVSMDDAKKYMADFDTSIKYGFQHEDDAVRYSLKYARYPDMELDRKFIKMYVNPLSVDFGEQGRKSLDLFFSRAFSMGFLEPFEVEIV